MKGDVCNLNAESKESVGVIAMSSAVSRPPIKRDVQSRIRLSDEPPESSIDASGCNSAAVWGLFAVCPYGIAQIPTRTSAPPLDRSSLHGVLASIRQLLRRPGAHWQRRQTSADRRV
jgi:hypothetical protein